VRLQHTQDALKYFFSAPVSQYPGKHTFGGIVIDQGCGLFSVNPQTVADNFLNIVTTVRH
jgi:hypothetical protein